MVSQKSKSYICRFISDDNMLACLLLTMLVQTLSDQSQLSTSSRPNEYDLFNHPGTERGTPRIRHKTFAFSDDNWPPNKQSNFKKTNDDRKPKSVLGKLVREPQLGKLKLEYKYSMYLAKN